MACKLLVLILEGLPKIKKVKMIGTIHKKDTRDDFRRRFADKGAKLMLSEWEQQAEELELEGKTIDEDDIYSDDCSEEEEPEEEEN